MPQRNTERPLPVTIQRFIDWMVRLRDPEKAALNSDLKASWGMKLYREPEIRAKIDRRIGLIERERDSLIAKAQALDISLLDSSLVDTIKTSAKDNGHVKVKAIELGYKRVGVLVDDNFIMGGGKSSGNDPVRPSMYSALEIQTTVTRTEQITTREITGPSDAPALPAPLPIHPTIEGKPTLRSSNVEIFNY